MLFMVEPLIGLRAEIVQRRMQPASVVEAFDVAEHVRARLVTGPIFNMMHALAFRGTEEALHRCIVVPSADTVHARLDAMGCQQHLIASIRVLTALLRVVDACQIK